MVEHESGTSFYTNPAEREAAWQRDRDTEAAPLPGAGQSHYSGEGQRQSAIYAASESIVAARAREAGVTSAEWQAKRKEIGKSPTPADFS